MTKPKSEQARWWRRVFRRRPHVHSGFAFDGMFERCRCGAWAGDLKSPNGIRYAFFDEWPAEARGLRPGMEESE